MTITLLVMDKNEYRVFKDAFKDTKINVEQGELRNYCSKNNYDAIVSPANFAGIMDGGVDKDIRDLIPGIQSAVQKAILEEYRGEQPIGTCLLVKCNEKYLFHCPTMRVPTKLPKDSLNAYLAFRAFLTSASKNKHIKDIVCVPMCTGTGRMQPEVAARQMRVAYHSVYYDNGYPTWGDVAKLNQMLGAY